MLIKNTNQNHSKADLKIINQNLHNKVTGFIVQKQPYNYGI
jgi:hypothetical protein